MDGSSNRISFGRDMRPGHREHLLLAADRLPPAGGPLGQHREERVHALEALVEVGARGGQEGAILRFSATVSCGRAGALRHVRDAVATIS